MSDIDDRDHADRPLRTLQYCALHRRTIRLTCTACGHVRKIDAVALWWAFVRRGWEDNLPEGYRRLYCQPCRDAGRIIRPRGAITRETADPTDLPYPDRTTWRQVVSRYRS